MIDTTDAHAIAEAILTQPAPPGRTLSWETVHRAYSYRIDPVLHQQMKQIRDELSGPQIATTLDLVADAIIAAGIEAYYQGHVQVTCTWTQTTTRGRP
jgi:hypothetical protein